MEITFKVLWTDFAINQLKDIFDYHLIKASPNIAQKLIQKIIDSTIILEAIQNQGEKRIYLTPGHKNFVSSSSKTTRLSTGLIMNSVL